MIVISDRYRLTDKVLGKGAFGIVYLGIDAVCNREVAIKSVKLTIRGISVALNKQKIEAEISLMASLTHPNIVKYYDNVLTDTSWYIIMEYCNYGTLADVISNLKPIRERESIARYYLTQLRDALKYLRQYDYVHRDIKPTNVLLSKERVVTSQSFGIFQLDEDYQQADRIVVKLADFGLTKCTDDNVLMQTICGSPMFMAPEVLLAEDYDSKADIWSFGVIMYQLLTGKYPREADSLSQLKASVLSPIDFHYEYGFSQSCYDLLTGLLAEKTKRYTWEALFNHEWFDAIECDISLDFTDQIGHIKPISTLGSSNLSKMKGVDSLKTSWLGTFEVI